MGSKAHSSAPVSAFSAMTRLYGVLKYSTLSIINGVAWKLPGRVPNWLSAFSRGDHSQATPSCDTVDALMSVSGENFIPP